VGGPLARVKIHDYYRTLPGPLISAEHLPSGTTTMWG
jgi:hypothetical protein